MREPWLQTECFDRDVLLDPEQNATPSVMSGHTDTRLIAGISIMELEHSVFQTTIFMQQRKAHMVVLERAYELKWRSAQALGEDRAAACIPLLNRSRLHTHI